MRLLPIVMMTVIACSLTAESQTTNNAGWKKINADDLFTFSLPGGFVKTNMMGVENYLGEYYNGQSRFLFVWHDTASYEYDERLMRDLVEVSTTIDGKPASVRTFSIIRDGVTSYLTELNVGDWHKDRVELYMSLESRNQADTHTAKQIFKSIKFPKKRRAHFNYHLANSVYNRGFKS